VRAVVVVIVVVVQQQQPELVSSNDNRSHLTCSGLFVMTFAMIYAGSIVPQVHIFIPCKEKIISNNM